MKTFLIKRIKQLMEERHISQADLARITGIRASSISDYLSGKYQPKQDKIALIADALNANPGWLLGYELENSESSNEIILTNDEISMIKKYRSLSSKRQEKFKNAIQPVVTADEQQTLALYRQLDDGDKAEIRGEMKGLLKADKYQSKASIQAG